MGKRISGIEISYAAEYCLPKRESKRKSKKQ